MFFFNIIKNLINKKTGEQTIVERSEWIIDTEIPIFHQNRNYIEKYLRTSGNGIDGLMCYNFCLHTDPFNLQPSGAMNMSRFTKIELETVTITPPINPLAQSLSICDPATGNIIGVNKNNWQIYQYNFNALIMEERVNFITFVGGNCGLAYAT